MGLCLSSYKAKRHGRRRQNPNHHPPTQETPKPQPQGKAKEKVSNKNKKKNTKNKIKWRHGGGVPYGKNIDFGYAKDFDKQYTIGKLLGHGQFGFAYVATENNNGDRVAVKKIEKAKMTQPIEVEDVRREVKILQALGGHENVVGFHNVFVDKNFVYIVME